MKKVCTVGKEWMAFWSALRPVAHVMSTNCPQGTAHANGRTEIYHHMLKLFMTFEAAVNHAAVKANGVATAQREETQDKKHGEG